MQLHCNASAAIKTSYTTIIIIILKLKHTHTHRRKNYLKKITQITTGAKDNTGTEGSIVFHYIDRQ
jgi:hypothetical protein